MAEKFNENDREKIWRFDTDRLRVKDTTQGVVQDCDQVSARTSPPSIQWRHRTCLY